jgi:XTP/dITP diphosphohydrolase
VDRIDGICRISISSSTETAHVLSLFLASGNAHKTREFAAMLGADYTVRDLTSASAIPAIEETGKTFEENAALKAVGVSKLVDGLVMADDSGLEVFSLDGAPGVYSARYAGEHARDEENVMKLLRELRTVSSSDDLRAARFCCVIALAKQGELLAMFHGEARGVIAEAPRGENGFGYDPVFVPDGFDQTFAELGDAVKNRTSHRAGAIRQLRDYLAQARNRP